jgi:hypothetical protein
MYGRYKNWHTMDVAEIQPRRKEVPYTITAIGGPEELKKWKAEQILLKEARDAYMKPIREALRLKVIGMVEAQNHDLSFTPEERAEIAYRKSQEAPQTTKRVEVVPYQLEPTENAPKGLLGVLKRIWKNAFPE